MTTDNVEDSASLDDSFSTIQEIITPTTSTTTTRSTTSSTGEAITQESQLSAMLSEDELQLMEALDQADNLLNMGAFGEFDRLTSGVEDLRLAALQPARSSASTSTTSSAADTAVAEQLNLLKEQVLLQCRQVQSCGVGFSAARIVVSSSDDEDTDTEEDQQETQITQLCLAIQAVIDTAPPLAGTRDLKNIRQALLGRWQLLFTNSEMCSFYHGVSGFTNVIPRAKFSSLAVEYTSDGYISEGKYLEKISTPLGELAVTACTNWELMEEPSFMSNADSIVLRNYCAKVTAGPFTFEAQENWKSLRALAMNEVMYVDDEMLIVRNCGALGIFFVFEKKE